MSEIPNDGPVALTVAQVREADRRAIEECGIPGLDLMENAGRGAAAVAMEMLHGAVSPRVLVLAGRGNNGGDGYVIARHLANAGVEVHVRVLSALDDIEGDARTNLDIIRNMGLDVRSVALPDEKDGLREELASSSLIVDALLGTGPSGEIRNPYRAAIELMNASETPVLAVDVPSGLDADTGKPLGTCTIAERTATFAAVKVGMLKFDASRYVGEFTVIDIGIPPEILAAVGGE